MLNLIFKMIQKCWNILETNFNIFNSILLSPFLYNLLKGICLKISEYKEKKIFELYYKRESDNFYAWIMIWEVVIYCISFLIVSYGKKLWPFVSFFGYKLIMNKEVTMVIVLMLSISVSFFILKMKWVRKRLLGDREGKNLILCSILLLNFGIVCVILGGIIKYFGSVCLVSFFICEVFGLLHFQGRYIRYNFSSVKLCLTNGEKVICKEIEKIYRRKKFLIVENGDKNIVLQYDNIWKVEYYGAPKVVMTKDVEKAILQFFKRRKQNMNYKRTMK